MHHLSSGSGYPDRQPTPNSQTSSAENRPPETPDGAAENTIAQANLDLLTASSPAERAAAARELGISGGPSATTYLIAALYDTSAEVCITAATVLGRIGDSTALVPLNQLLNRLGGPNANLEIVRSIQAIKGRAQAASAINESINQSKASAPCQVEKVRQQLDESAGRGTTPETCSRAQADIDRVNEIEVMLKLEGQQLLADTEARLTAQELSLQLHRRQLREDAEREQLHEAEIETLTKAQIRQLKRIEQAQKYIREIEARGNEATAQEIQLREETEKLRSVEASRKAAADLRQQTLDELAQDAREQEQNIVVLEPLRKEGFEQTAKFLEYEHRLVQEIETLKQTEAQQRESLAQIETRRLAQQVVVRETEAEVATRTAEEQERLAQLSALRAKADEDAQHRGESLHKLVAQLENLRHIEIQQLETLAQTQMRLSAAEEKRQKTEEAISQHLQREKQLDEELEALRKNGAHTIGRIRAAEEKVRQARSDASEAEAQELELLAQAKAAKESAETAWRQTEFEIERQTEEQELPLADLQVLQTEAANQANNRSEAIEELNFQIKILRAAEDKQLQAIQRAQAQLQEAEAKARRLAEELSELQHEAQFQTAEAVRFREGAAAKRLELEETLQKQAQQEEQHLIALESIREAAKSASEERLRKEHKIAAEIERLGAAELEGQKRLAEVERESEARRIAAEERQREVEEECRRQLEEDAQLQERLEFLRAEAEEQMRRSTATAEKLRTEIELLAQTELTQTKQLLELEVDISAARKRLSGFEQRRTELEAEAKHCVELEQQLIADFDRLQAAKTEQLQRNAETKAQTECFAVEVAKLQNQLAQLSGVHSLVQTEFDARSAQYEQLQSSIEVLRGQEALQLNQLEVARQQLQASETAVKQSADRVADIEAEIATLQTIETDQLERIIEAEVRLSQAKSESARLHAEEASVVADAEEFRRAEDVWREAAQQLTNG